MRIFEIGDLIGYSSPEEGYIYGIVTAITETELEAEYDLAKEILCRYDYSEKHLDEMLGHFRISSNAIYPFLTESRKFCFLRLSPVEEKAPSEVESELRFIEWLREKGYPAMKPYPMKNGLLRDVIETKWGTCNVTCFENVEGDTPKDYDGDVSVAYGYGRTPAELHNLSAEYPTLASGKAASTCRTR